MKLIVGLGNPGKKYDGTWHNLGFAAIEELRAILDMPPLKKSDKLRADMCIGTYGSERLILAEPLTFMNNSGESVQAIAAFHKVKFSDITVIQDDIDLPLGKLRLAKDSSAGGHNGIKSIIEETGTKSFNRIKIGIKTGKLGLIDAADYVLMKPDKTEKLIAKEQIKNAAKAAKDILDSGLEKAMNIWN